MPTENTLVPQLIEATGRHAGRVHELPYGEHIVGRGGGASIQLNDQDVSRRHARLVVGPEGVTVHDLGSKNGIFSQGRRVDGEAQLTHGQSFSFGELTLMISHPASQVSKALRRAGETTVTTTRTGDTQKALPLGLILPAAGVVLFGVLVVVLLVTG